LWHLSTAAPSNQDQPALHAHEREPAMTVVLNDVEPDNPTKADQAVQGFKFPDDQSGMLLAKILPPSESLVRSAASLQAKPRLLAAPHVLEHPTILLPPARFEVTHLPQTKRLIHKPRPLPDPLPI